MTKKPFIVDAHQDLAFNMLSFERDYTRTVAETRQIETKNQTPEYNGDTMIGWDAYQAGRVGIVFSTLFAAPIRRKMGDWDSVVYETPEQAHTLYRQQIDAYHRLVETHPDKFTLIQTKPDLSEVLAAWENAAEDQEPPVGLAILMEAAEGIRQPTELELWWNLGVRLIGPAWAGTRFCGGTREPGPLTKEGYALLDGMADHGFVLDISHMDEKAVLQSLDHYPGQIIASHANPQGMLTGLESNRFLPDRVIEGLIERDAVIGIVLYNKFLHPEWKKGANRKIVPLELIVDHIDYICQIAGDAKHIGIGSDADGGFGLQDSPHGIDSIADIQKLSPILSNRGYSDEDIISIFSKNWITILEGVLPETL